MSAVKGKREQPHAAPPPVKRPGILKPKPRSLIVIADGDPNNATALSEYLEAYGYRTEVCTTGAEAVRLAERLKPDVILMDIALPDFSGVEATKRIRLNKRTRMIPVVGISGLREIPDPEMQGFDDFVEKPISLVALEDIIRRQIVPRK